MGLSKLLNKINKAKSAINSLKGISSKIQELNYTSQIDKLGDEALKAKDFLNDSRKRESALLAGVEVSQSAARSTPSKGEIEFRYPLNDHLENTIVFSIRPRRRRSGEAGKNVLSENSTEIMLYLPEGLKSDAAVSYGETELGRTARAGSDMVDTYKNEGLAAAAEVGVDAALAAGDSFLTALGDTMTGGAANVRAGRATNPMIETTFQGVSFRSFSFEYEFWPKNDLEAEEVQNIIYTFRSAMLPDTYGSGGEGAQANTENYFNFPNIFDVEYDGPVANHLDGYLPMVMTSCNVDHFNGNKVATFANGQPVSTKLSMSFQEIKILSQESYQEISPKGDKSITSMGSLVDDSQDKYSNIEEIEVTATKRGGG